jgi:NAD(P)-dependent dehydrogenase (short-subunit alcohol dehydrogenase family)
MKSSIQQLCAWIVAMHRWLDGMVYNAVSRPMTGFGDGLAKWEESMRLNATGFFAAVRTCGDVMTRAGRGSIVNISSQMGMIGHNPYLYDGGTAVVPPDYFSTKAV